MLEEFAFGPRNKPHPSSPTALAHNAKPRQASGMTYTGETNSKGERHGQGTAWLADLSTYTGEWRDGVRNGQGTMTYANGTTYTGEWKDDLRNGQGTYTNAYGDTYTGEWKDGLANGQGTYTYADGTVR